MRIKINSDEQHLLSYKFAKNWEWVGKKDGQHHGTFFLNWGEIPWTKCKDEYDLYFTFSSYHHYINWINKYG